MDNLLEVTNLSKEYMDDAGYKTVLFEDISIFFDKSKFTTLLAPTGSGKTSLLKIIAGLDSQSSGMINNSAKSIVYIPSDSATFPWMNVKQNVVYNLSNVDENEINKAFSFVGLDGYEDHFPHQQSYGFHFRTSLARSLVRKPDIILLDEPFEIIKPSIKQSLLELTRKISSELNIAVVLATTSISRAILLSDKIYLMNKNPGKIIDEFDVTFGIKRDSELYVSAEYKLIKESILSKIEKDVSLHENEFTL